MGKFAWAGYSVQLNNLSAWHRCGPNPNVLSVSSWFLLFSAGFNLLGLEWCRCAVGNERVLHPSLPSGCGACIDLDIYLVCMASLGLWSYFIYLQVLYWTPCCLLILSPNSVNNMFVGSLDAASLSWKTPERIAFLCGNNSSIENYKS